MHLFFEDINIHHLPWLSYWAITCAILPKHKGKAVIVCTDRETYPISGLLFCMFVYKENYTEFFLNQMVGRFPALKMSTRVDKIMSGLVWRSSF